MSETDYNARLYEKMKAEQNKYRDRLLHQEPSEILNHTYEYRGSDVPPGESARNIKIGRVSKTETRPIFFCVFFSVPGVIAGAPPAPPAAPENPETHRTRRSPPFFGRPRHPQSA